MQQNYYYFFFFMTDHNFILFYFIWQTLPLSSFKSFENSFIQLWKKFVLGPH